MRPGAHIKAAVEVLDEILGRHRPAAAALADWGKSHRFAGSGDRAAIGNLVYDALRRKRSLAAQMGSDTPRALALGRRAARARPVAGGRHRQRRRLAACARAAERGRAGRRCRATLPADAPASVRGDFPDWLEPSFARAFGDAAAEEGAALARRAPVDLRVNTLKADRDEGAEGAGAVRAVADAATRRSACACRRPTGPAGSPTSRPRPAHGKGWYEVQDEGSQIAALMAGAGPRQQVLDICAGAGGKTLAFAAAMRNTGQIYAYDDDACAPAPHLRAAEAGRRAQRPGAARPATRRRSPRSGPRFDLVFVDAPCTGTGRLAPPARCQVAAEARPTSPQRQEEQRAVLGARRRRW